MNVAVRPYRPEDLGAVLELWERLRPRDGLGIDQAADLLRADGAVALVAEDEGGLVGMVLGVAGPVVGWVHRLAVPEGAGETAAALLSAFESRVAEDGVRRIGALAGPDAESALRGSGYLPSDSASYLERRLRGGVAGAGALAEAGGRMIAPGLWSELKGMDEAKEIIERRVILPLAEPELALRHGVVTPKAIVLFGPPGTGKTTFAKGIASRLQWPFVEIQPAEIGGEGPERQAKLLAQSFDRVLALASAVIFVDEVEDLASQRTEERRVSPSVTNEFLKQVPRLREAPHHLLVCATNWIDQLDSAFLRPGRFDFILPVGPPNAEARAAIWRRYVSEITDEPVDVDALVAASELFTPADIEFAARTAAQRSFERAHFDGVEHRAVTGDFVATIADTKPTLSPELVAGFAGDIERFARF